MARLVIATSDFVQAVGPVKRVVLLQVFGNAFLNMPHVRVEDCQLVFVLFGPKRYVTVSEVILKTFSLLEFGVAVQLFNVADVDHELFEGLCYGCARFERIACANALREKTSIANITYLN